MPNRFNRQPPLKKGESDFDRPIKTPRKTAQEIERGLRGETGIRPFAPGEKDYEDKPARPRPMPK